MTYRNTENKYWLKEIPTEILTKNTERNTDKKRTQILTQKIPTEILTKKTQMLRQKIPTMETMALMAAAVASSPLGLT